MHSPLQANCQALCCLAWEATMGIMAQVMCAYYQAAHCFPPLRTFLTLLGILS